MLDVDLTTLLTAWRFRPMIILFIGLLFWLHQRGYPHTPWISRRQQRAFRFSLFILGLALLTSIDSLAGPLFFMRVTQHILLVSVFPLAFMSADPFETLYAGLPDSWKVQADHVTDRLYPFLEKRMTKGICWFVFIASVWMWYDKAMVDWTLAYPWLRNIELIMITSGALLHWWHVKAAAPRIHPKLPTFPHMIYTLAGAAPLKVPGLFLLFSISPFYTYPVARFFGWEIDALLSQQIGGAVVWTLAGTVYTVAFIQFFSAWMATEAKKPPLPLADWDTDENFIAPHLE